VEIDWTVTLTLVAVLIPSVILHEVSHGVVALLLGDDTAKRAGRLTLNPLPHVDPFGTVILPGLLALGGLGAFGYAKPVPVSPGRLRSPRQHALYVSLVGPAVNVALALAAALAYRALRPEPGSLASLAIVITGQVNVVLAVFNLLPVPPLDGSALVERVLPPAWWPAWLRLKAWSFGLLLLLVLVVPDRTLSPLFRWAFDLWAGLL
jgi:Zn-dependent protease